MDHFKEQSGIRARAVLVGLSSPVLPLDVTSDDDTLDELEQLLITAGGSACGKFLQRRDTPDSAMLIGEGKAQEIKEFAEINEADSVVFDNDLTPSQLRNLERAIDLPIIDRSTLILDIFAQRARSSEGRLQVELAQYKYVLPRLTRMWTHLVRQTASGGTSPIGTRGPGETQLETDRRHIRRKIQRLEAELREVRKTRGVQRERRLKSGVPMAALVGYTNAGKSTLLNTLTGADIPANDRLFDTLDPTTRKLKLNEHLTVLFSDTVGFIRKLPHNLVEAFKATLEELQYADVILHVVDLSGPLWPLHADVVERLIDKLGLAETPVIRVYNKQDLAEELPPLRGSDVLISARSGEGVDTLLKAVEETLSVPLRDVRFHFAYDQAGALEELYRVAEVKEVSYEQDYIEAHVICDEVVLGRTVPKALRVEHLSGGSGK